MTLYCIEHPYLYELENLLRVFFPLERITVKTVFSGEENGDYFLTERAPAEGGALLTARFQIGLSQGEKTHFALAGEDEERAFAVLMFYLLSEYSGFVPKWGILTGVRPSKLMTSLCEQLGEEGAAKRFQSAFLVSPKKTELARVVSKAEKKIIALSGPASFSLYVSIPFCPSRCSYCSFVSHSIASPSAKKLIPEYLDLLCKEIAETAVIAKKNGLSLQTVYWGGGTPTVLEAPELDRILTCIEENFDLSGCLEYTVEAGRPDTVTNEKLRVLKKHGVSRISINPQTFNDSVLQAVGRRHTAEETVDAFLLARSLGFAHINMDLIAGLPTDTPESFKNSVDRALALAPENITVHTLALKRSSELVSEQGAKGLDKNAVSDMIEYVSETLPKAGYSPYYMYRQSKSLGCLENVGWCRAGEECLYNVFMIEECETVLSVGAGGVTKLCTPDGGHIERIFNFKYPFEYNSRFETLLRRKDRISAFYAEYKLI